MYARINQSKALRSIRDSSPNYTPCNVAAVADNLMLSSSSSSFYLPRENDKYNNKGNVHGMKNKAAEVALTAATTKQTKVAKITKLLK